MSIDRDNRGKIFHFEFPNRLWAAKLLQPDAEDALHALSVNLGSTANAVKINATVVAAGLLCLSTHAAFSNHGLDTKTLDNIRLVGLFANRRGRTCSDDPVIFLI